MKFEEFQKTCKYKTYQSLKCIHEKNIQRMLVGSCKEKLCPLKAEWQKKPVAPEPAQQ